MDDAREPDAPLVFAPGHRHRLRGQRAGGGGIAAERQRARPGKAARAAMSTRALPRPTSSSKTNTARRCRRIAAWRPHAIVADWRADGLTVYSRPSSPPACERTGAGFRAAAATGCGWWSMRWAAVSARSRAPAIMCAPRSRCRGRPARRCAWCSIAQEEQID